MPRKAPVRLGRPPEPGAAYRRIAADLRRRMRSGEWPPGAVLPPWRALAHTYRVGVRVIQRASEALKRDGLLAANAQRRLVARNWDSPGTAMESRILVLLTSNPWLFLGQAYTDDLLLGILRGAGEVSAPVVVAYDDRLCTGVPAELLEAPLRGVVIVGKIGSSALRAWEKVAVPVVLADHPGGNWKLHASSVDNAGATREAVRRLLERGHRRLAFVRRMHTHHVHDVDPDARERQQVFEAERAACGIGGVKTEVFSFFSQDRFDAPGIAAIFKHAPRFTAVVTSDTGGATLVLQAARAAGLAVPRDLSVLSYGYVRTEDPAVSGPRFDFREVGRMAARLVASPRSPPQHATATSTWFEGKTFGPAPSR
ncbi:MAG: substrate-binding domain-containing protein [Planctomycetes bacterium]|nr:substrate-binding domain-containing protein [Planctomycetota bacterium]